MAADDITPGPPGKREMSDEEDAKLQRMKAAVKAWRLAPLGDDAFEVDEVIKAFEAAREPAK